MAITHNKSSILRFYSEVGQLIKKAREEKNIPQGRLGLRIGLSRTSVNNIEHGRQRIMLDTLLILSDILNIPMTKLLPKGFSLSQSIDEILPPNTSDSTKKFVKDLEK